ncbi:GNAT family N-acetyltransferase [Halobiforma nitratireducens]|uniref:GCN5-like N-acetyltransferase n=1 Tax=Halobiforma nitratireducens JCM 10879 TaxID=1227454 RepID=M0M511_9EURY|nr:GNAT family N-acetyltransferase [Halobiforma nitratireducens]EMA40897.1 GCN5-like N-acetyltransferase [Halobiforma nitratireducens JCM 10879]
MTTDAPPGDRRIAEPPFVRPASLEDALEVRRILDAAMLEPGDVEARIEADDVFVAGDRRRACAVSEAGDGNDDPDGNDHDHDRIERILGTIVLEPIDGKRGAHVSAIGVRRRHRNDGIGRRLIRHALEREGRLTARFDDDVRPFYESLAFAIEPLDDRRYRGELVADATTSE